MATRPPAPRRKISVSSADAPLRPSESVAWYPGSSPESIELAIRGALGLAPDAAIYATEQSSGFVVARAGVFFFLFLSRVARALP